MDSRIEKNYRSILALSEMLLDISNHPDLYLRQESVVEALKSQGALAKFADSPRGISPASINTQKRIADNMLEGGFQGLNRLRKTALTAIQKKSSESVQPDKDTKAGLLLKIKQIEVEKQSLRDDLLLLTLAFEKSLRQGARYAKSANITVQALCKKEQRELLDIISLKKNSLNTNVKRLRED